jgi:hypothetical protein
VKGAGRCPSVDQMRAGGQAGYLTVEFPGVSNLFLRLCLPNLDSSNHRGMHRLSQPLASYKAT